MRGSHSGCERGPLVNADALRPHLIAQIHAGIRAPVAETNGRIAHGQAARHIDIAGDGHDGKNSVTCLNAVLVLVDS